jgi:glycosyltransferase involved in cell wall biosynthesis
MAVFSLIVGTVGRTTELSRFLGSIDAQSFKDLELIVVDQNPDDRLIPVLREFETRFRILHMRSRLGLSRSRNVGLQAVSGDIVAFPDDDCWYAPDVLDSVYRQLAAAPQWDGITGRCTDEEGRSSMGRFDKHAGALGFLNVWRRCTSFTIFLRRHVVESVGLFDETLGLGSGTRWGAAEEMDYMIRSVRRGFEVHYDPQLVVYHRVTGTASEKTAGHRQLYYGMGIGRVMRLHAYPLWFVAWFLIRPLGGAVIALFNIQPLRAGLHLNTLYGRLVGWLASL